MFLAYDAHTGKVWTLEGNSGNQVKVKSRALDEVFTGVGYIKRAVLR